MPIFTKSKKKQSSRQQIAIQGVRDGVLMLPRHRYRMILQISSINFELKSEAEQDAIIDTYQSFLNSLATPLQILVRVREMDMDKYLDTFTEKVKHEAEPVYREQVVNYTDFVRKLVLANKILARHFYVIVPFEGDEKDFSVVHEQLSTSADLVAKGLARLGMQCRKLDSLEVLDLFYSFYCPAEAKRQPLSAQTMRALMENHV